MFEAILVFMLVHFLKNIYSYFFLFVRVRFFAFFLGGGGGKSVWAMRPEGTSATMDLD